MAVVEIDGDKIAVKTQFRDRDLVKQIPGKGWDADDRVWRVPLSWAACLQLRSTFRDDLTIGENLVAWATEVRERRVDVCLALREAEDAELPGEEKLFPFQRAGVQFLVAAEQALLGDDMGCGKTVQTIRTLEHLEDAFPALIVCPNSMRGTWEREYATWAPNRTVVNVQGSAAKRRKALERDDVDVFIMNWESIRSHSRLAPYGYIKLDDKEKEPKELNKIGLRTVVADEAHRAKQPQSKQTRALWWLGRQARYRYALTGTPIANKPEDLWSLMHFVDPKEWPAKTQFIDRYCLQSWSAFGSMETVGIKAEMREEFFSILDPRFIRRPKKVVLPQLPEKLPPEDVYVDLSTKQRKAYDSLRKDMMAELNDGTILMTANPLVRLTRMHQLCQAMINVEEEIIVPPDEDAEEYLKQTITLADPSAKLDALEEIIDSLGDQKAIVFAESRQMIDLAVKRLSKRKEIAVGQITGGIPDQDRQEYMRRLNDEHDNMRVLCLTLGAGGEGLTLTGANVVIFLQRGPSRLKNAQAEDRAHRPGQTRAVRIINLWAKDTCEQRIAELLQEKDIRFEEVVRDEETLRTWLNK